MEKEIQKGITKKKKKDSGHGVMEKPNCPPQLTRYRYLMMIIMMIIMTIMISTEIV